MITVCLIGNSHVANLKKALPSVAPDFPGIETAFFASEGVSMELDIVDGKLRGRAQHVRDRMAMTSGTDGDIAPIYDAYVACGLTLSSMRAIRAFHKMLKDSEPAVRKKRFTPEEVAEIMAPAIRGSLAIAAVDKLRRLTQAPIFVIATPLAAYERHDELWQGLEKRGRLELLEAAYTLACTGEAAAHGAVFVPQPLETIGPNVLTTRPEFYLTSPEAVKDEAAQHAHMNTAFGAIVLRDVLARIAAALGAN
ncbi:MAG TPA: hypothetical protein VG889_04810 [Rhizomicrobium sp.]|nr:hypothetical protein [Rhizomicrobium sp.]